MIPGVLSADEFCRRVEQDYRGGFSYYYYEFNGNTICDIHLK